ncbi:MAG: 50S ribosomal protein L15 [Bacteroidota bacterium]
MAKDLLSNLTPAAGSRRKAKRIGRGQGSGRGGTSTRGHKGAGSRAGAKHRAWFEGGQMPLARRVPKRGFHSPFRKEFQIVNLGVLDRLTGDGRIQDGVVTPEVLSRLGLIRTSSGPIKILGGGELKNRLAVSAHAFSASALEKIRSAGGKAETISSTPNV